MRKTTYMIAAALMALAASCMDGDWEEPAAGNAYGNPAIEETGVVSIAGLKDEYAQQVFASQDSYALITGGVKIKGTVTANDIQGNIYNEVAIDDGTGAILVCIAQGGLYAYLPVGQQVLIDLDGLYIGGYGQQPEIGTPYTNARGKQYISRMSRILWGDHFRLMGMAGETPAPEVFNTAKVKDQAYLKSHCGRLMTIKGVQLEEADGMATFAPEDLKDAGNSVNRAVKGISKSNLVVRTSTYADFAAKAMPEGKVDITGIFTRYRDTWQILMRTEDDIQPAK